MQQLNIRVAIIMLQNIAREYMLLIKILRSLILHFTSDYVLVIKIS